MKRFIARTEELKVTTVSYKGVINTESQRELGATLRRFLQLFSKK